MLACLLGMVDAFDFEQGYRVLFECHLEMDFSCSFCFPSVFPVQTKMMNSR